MIYSGYNTVEGSCAGALHINKPATHGALVAVMEGLMGVPTVHPVGTTLRDTLPA